MDSKQPINYLINYKTPGFENTPEWSASFSNMTITWIPQYPYIFSDGSPQADRVVSEVRNFIFDMSSTAFDDNDEVTIPPVGPTVVAGPSNPYAVRYALESIRFAEELEFSENAPRFDTDEFGEPESFSAY